MNAATCLTAPSKRIHEQVTDAAVLRTSHGLQNIECYEYCIIRIHKSADLYLNSDYCSWTGNPSATSSSAARGAQRGGQHQGPQQVHAEDNGPQGARSRDAADEREPRLATDERRQHRGLRLAAAARVAADLMPVMLEHALPGHRPPAPVAAALAGSLWRVVCQMLLQRHQLSHVLACQELHVVGQGEGHGRCAPGVRSSRRRGVPLRGGRQLGTRTRSPLTGSSRCHRAPRRCCRRRRRVPPVCPRRCLPCSPRPRRAERRPPAARPCRRAARVGDRERVVVVACCGGGSGIF
mmetsp:Transcript_104901/g.281927  ORF Transcript_104901/g.281927 Transcript_104901/m.281927 type:complete len:294 (+) Transcript_104901:151-1032(+)